MGAEIGGLGYGRGKGKGRSCLVARRRVCLLYENSSCLFGHTINKRSS